MFGPGRAGSSRVYKKLKLHPEVYIPQCKSTQYFSKNYDKGVDWYKEFFKGAKSRAVGEASVGYLSTPEAPARIYQLLPDVKLIAVLRHPVDMAYSNFNRLQALAKPRTLNARATFAEKIKHTPRLLKCGRYAKLLKSYFKYFDRENVVVMFFDDLVKDN